MNKNYKFGGNEAWLRAQADGDKSEIFDQGMSFIKNAADTSDLHGRMMSGPIQDASERSMVEPGITGRPDWDTFGEFAPGYDQELPAYADPKGYDADEIFGDIAPDTGEPPGGYLDASDLISNQVGPGPWNELDPYNTSMQPVNPGAKVGKSKFMERQVFDDLYDFPKGTIYPSYVSPPRSDILGREILEDDEYIGR
jgi:hypothetical protein